MCLGFWNLTSLAMQRCPQFKRATRFIAHLLRWRTARLLCAVWFTLTSIGLPGSFSQMGGVSCARNPGSQCRCSLTKRMSGSCCCSREAQQPLAKSCCSVKKVEPKLPQPAASACCWSRTLKVELSVTRCDCPSDAPESVSLIQEPRLPAAASVVFQPKMIAALVALPAERVESALLLPPVPPPKVVLS